MVTLEQRQQLRQHLSQYGDGFVISIDELGDFNVLITKEGSLEPNSIPHWLPSSSPARG